MSETHILLPGAQTPVPVRVRKHPAHWSYKVIFIIGVVAVLAGAADVLARFSHTVLGECGTSTAFGPAISAIDPLYAPQAEGADNCN